MSGLAELFRFCVMIYQCTNGFESVVGGNTGSATVANEINRNSERSFKCCSVPTHHQLEPELFTTILDQRRADQSSSMGGHEIYDLWCNSFCSANEVTFVFAVLVINHND